MHFLQPTLRVSGLTSPKYWKRTCRVPTLPIIIIINIYRASVPQNVLTGASQCIIIQSYTITAPLRSIHPLLPIWSGWSYSTIQYRSLSDQVAHVGVVACLRPQCSGYVRSVWDPALGVHQYCEENWYTLRSSSDALHLTAVSQFWEQQALHCSIQARNVEDGCHWGAHTEKLFWNWSHTELQQPTK